MDPLDHLPPFARLSFPSYREALFHEYLVSKLLKTANAKPNNNEETRLPVSRSIKRSFWALERISEGEAENSLVREPCELHRNRVLPAS